MGQYLSTGLVYKFNIRKEHVDKIKLPEKEAIKGICREFIETDKVFFDMKKDNDGDFLFNLKSEHLEKSLIPFLDAFYKDFYVGKSKKYEGVLEELNKTKDSKKWLELLHEKRFECFQIGNYMESYPIEIKTINPDYSGWDSMIYIDFETILLTLEGKVMMECHESHFSFFRQLMREKYAKFELANLISIAITG